LAALGGTLATAFLLNGFNVLHFVYAFLATALVVEFAHALNKNRRLMSLPGSLAATALMVVLIAAAWHDLKRTYQSDLHRVLSAMAPGGNPAEALRKRSARLQASVPAGATVLARLQYPFLLDFKRNVVYIIDWPCATGIRSTIPCFNGPESLARYLVADGIRYVAYDYAAEAGYSHAVFVHRLEPANPWFTRVAARSTFDFQASLKQLGGTRRRIYDDGQTFVLDLTEGATMPWGVGGLSR
jgi:hypothetical protein